jgi:two-component system response regulator NreC
VSDGGFDLVGTADSLDAAVRCARAYHPEVLVIDLLRLVEGRDVGGGLQPLRQEVPSVAIVILTDDRDPIMAREALSNGARAYTLKSARAHELYDAVHCAAKGETYLAPQLGGAVADLTMGRNGHALTARESEVLRLVALGYTNTEIASAQFLSVRTIETHRARLHAKLGTSTRAELVQVARKRGLLG